jgi:Family of unknown function (DUF6174)
MLRVQPGMTNGKHRRLVVVGGACVLAMVGCGSGSEEGGGGGATTAQTAGWVEPPAYEYTVDSRCGEQFLIGRFTLTVADSKVSEVVGADAGSVKALEWMKLDGFPTLGELLKEAQRAQSENADVVEVAFDPADGHPTKIRLDYDTNAIDDESCYDILGFAAP